MNFYADYIRNKLDAVIFKSANHDVAVSNIDG